MVMMENEPSGCCSPPSWLDQRDIRERTRTFQSLAAYSFAYNFLLRLGDQSMRLHGGYVTHDYFGTLGVNPVIGRFSVHKSKKQTVGWPCCAGARFDNGGPQGRRCAEDHAIFFTAARGLFG